MAKIYWFTGGSGVGKTVLAKKLVEFLSTEKRNWRSKVFHIDDSDIEELLIETENIDTVKHTQLLAEFIYKSGCDVVVSVESPHKEFREEFKSKIGNDIEEFYVHSSKKISSTHQSPDINFFDVDTTRENATQSFNKIVYYLREK